MISFDLSSFAPSRDFGKEPLPVFHDSHTLATWSKGELMALIESVPLGKIKTKIPAQDWGDGFNYQRTTREMLERLYEMQGGDFWIAIHQIEEHLPIADLFHEMAGFLMSSLPELYGRVKLCTGSLFISRGAATTPYHMDYGSNLLLQVSGRKRFLAFSPNDQDLVSKQSLMEFFGGSANPASLRYDKSFESKAMILELEPGKGIYMPSTSPHCTATKAEGLSITVSLSFVSPIADRLRRVSQFDCKLPSLQFIPVGLKCALSAGYETFREATGRGSPRHESFKPLRKH